jgi:topoisomerase-4 subunit A
MVFLKNGFKKPISAIYYDGKERYYIKRFLVETENKEESFITGTY